MPTASRSGAARAVPAAAAALVLAALPAAAQGRVEYEISFPNAVHHEAEVVATFRGVPAGKPLQVRMSRSSPGRYALHEFAKNVYSVRAADAQGRALAVTRPDPYGWDVTPGADGTVRFSYTLFGDRVDGTYAGIDDTHAHLNMPAVFAWARGMETAPIQVAFRRRPGWDVATQLVPTADPSVFTAPNLQYFLDSPAELGPVKWRSWQITSNGKPVTVRIAMHHAGTDAELDAYAEATRKIVAEEAAVYGEMPADFGTYTFIVDYLPWNSGDGMEHRNSTVITSSRPLSTSLKGNLGTVSHELFHFWNVERMRPRSLEPFDFERANMSGELWFAEGFTSYYDDLFLRRAGILTDAEYGEALTGIVNAVTVMPGKRYFSPVEMSMQAPFVDAAASIDPQNRANTFISYYTIGSAVGLGLDLAIRERFPNRTLDDFMRGVWQRQGRLQSAALAPERPYTVDDLERILGEVMGDAAFARDFFARHVRGRDLPDFERLLAPAGFLVRRAQPGKPWAGPVSDRDGKVVVGQTLVGSPLYQAGLDAGDQIVSLDGRPVGSVAEYNAAAAAKPLGTPMVIEYQQPGRNLRATVTFTEMPNVEVVPFEAAGRELTPAMRAFRASWLGARAGR
jgi:predicted metalloprotease with PDZ domain